MTLVHAFISSRLDYCNSLLVGVGEGLLQKIQRVQNAAARLVTGTRKYEHITPVLRALHWLPIRQRIFFKIAVPVYKCLHNLAPSYLADELLPLESVSGRRQLRWTSNLERFIPRTRTISFGPWAFAVCGPTIWNSLPSELRDPDLTDLTLTLQIARSCLEPYYQDAAYQLRSHGKSAKCASRGDAKMTVAKIET